MTIAELARIEETIANADVRNALRIERFAEQSADVFIIGLRAVMDRLADPQRPE